jgi:asparagine synthase (glutamine-hydrolysing)
MCGFTGIWNLSGKAVDTVILSKMNDSIKHRGPNDEGYFLYATKSQQLDACFGKDTLPDLKAKLNPLPQNTNADFAMGFRRLSIIDLSAKGHQPMSTEDSRYWIVFNGEVYNFPEIRKNLKSLGYTFRSGTDTEVILKAYLEWGKDCLHKFNGMWAFAIFDKKEQSLFCARDRFGIKPFYFSYTPNHHFVFASEIKALLYLVPFAPNPDAIQDYFLKGISCHNEQTFFKDIFQLEPGTFLVLKNKQLKVHRYYDASNTQASSYNFQEATNQFRALLDDAIRLRQRSDVPVGYALSGGLDSSSIVCLAATQKDKVSDQTFSLVFPNYKVDESPYINSVVQQTGFKANSFTLSSDALYRELEQFVWHQEEPFGGVSYFGEFKLRALIKNKGVTVSLEGQGADEIVSGYVSLMPYYYYDLLQSGKLATFFKETKDFYKLTNISTKAAAKSYLAQLINRKSALGNSKYPFLQLSTTATAPFSSSTTSKPHKSYLNNALLSMLTKTSIPEQLTRADKSAMAYSIECRFPFLDHRLVDFANTLPYHYKINNGTTKYILREALKGIIPEKVYQRRDKIGFAIPIQDWVAPPLWEKMNDYLASSHLPILDKATFQKTYPNLESIDWKYWKTISLVLWEHVFSDFSKRHLLRP